MKPGRQAGGFTLMELLVALTLLGILMTTLFGSLRFGARVWETSDDLIEGGGTTETVRHFLRARMEGALPINAGSSGNQAAVLFEGGSHYVRFAASMPLTVGSDLFLQEVALNRQSSESGEIGALTYRWHAMNPDSAEAAATAGERILVDDIGDVAIHYFGRQADRAEAAWYAAWQDNATLPELIKIEIGFHADDRRHWPTLLIAPMIDDWDDQHEE